MSLLPWKIKTPPTQTIEGLKIPDYKSLLVDESAMLMQVIELEKKDILVSTQSKKVMVAYGLAVRFKLEDQVQAIEQAISNEEYPAGTISDILPITLSMVSLNAIWDLMLGAPKKSEAEDSEGKPPTGQRSSGRSESTILVSLPTSEDAQSA